MAVNILKEKKQVERFLAVMLIVCFITCIVGLIQVPAGDRVTAPFEGEVGEPNTMGGYLILMISVILGLLLTNERKTVKPFLLLLLLLCVITLALTLSRGSWVALIPMVITLIYFTDKKSAIIIPLIFIIAFSPILLPQSVKDRFYYTFMQPHDRGEFEIAGFRLDTSTSARLASWKRVLTKDLGRHPVLGYGVTGHAFVDAQYPRTLVETGILGLSCLIILLSTIFRHALRVYRQTKDLFFKGLTLGYLVGFVGLVFHGFGANTFIIVRIMEPFWFLTAMITMIPQLEYGAILHRPDDKAKTVSD
jgi:O-antigen ligase